VRRTVGRWVNTSYRRRPMIVPLVIEAWASITGKRSIEAWASITGKRSIEASPHYFRVTARGLPSAGGR
jgi:hypothetical protein